MEFSPKVRILAVEEIIFEENPNDSPTDDFPWVIMLRSPSVLADKTI